jgi:4-amino-4-deoxy-L-arabinose transferase-like glycosyltransferase
MTVFAKLRISRWYLAASVGLILLAVLLQPTWLGRLRPDNSLNANNTLALTLLRIFLALIGLIVAIWPALAERRLRAALIVLLLLITILPRCVRLNDPFLDYLSHRQTDNATLARNYFEKNPNILWPEVNWYADRPNYIESTFTLMPWLTSLGYRAVGEQPWVARSLAVLFSALGVISLFGLVGLYWGQAAGFLAALFLAISPMALYVGRSFMDDIPALMLGIAGLLGVAVWLRKGRWWALVLGLLALTLSLMVKVVTLYFYFPLAALLWDRWRWRAFRQPAAWLILGLPLLPTAAWYAWARHIGQQYLTFGIGGPASNEHTVKWSSAAEVFRWSYFRKIGNRVNSLVITLPATLTLIPGVIAAGLQRGTGWLIFGSWVLGVAVFTLISGKAQWIHNYYQLPFAAALAPFIGVGLAAIWERKTIGRLIALGLVLWLAVASARSASVWYNVWQGSVPHEAQVVQAMTGPDDRIITVVWDNDPTLLYHLHRPGWIANYLDPTAVAEVPQWLQKDARLLILQDMQRPEAQWLWDQPWLRGLELIERGPDYAIYRVP